MVVLIWPVGPITMSQAAARNPAFIDSKAMAQLRSG
jgi:hypothetical protein